MSNASVLNFVLKTLQHFTFWAPSTHLTATQNILRCEVCFKCILPMDGKVVNKINISWLEQSKALRTTHTWISKSEKMFYKYRKNGDCDEMHNSISSLTDVISKVPRMIWCFNLSQGHDWINYDSFVSMHFCSVWVLIQVFLW